MMRFSVHSFARSTLSRCITEKTGKTTLPQAAFLSSVLPVWHRPFSTTTTPHSPPPVGSSSSSPSSPLNTSNLLKPPPPPDTARYDGVPTNPVSTSSAWFARKTIRNPEMPAIFTKEEKAAADAETWQEGQGKFETPASLIDMDAKSENRKKLNKILAVVAMVGIVVIGLQEEKMTRVHDNDELLLMRESDARVRAGKQRDISLVQSKAQLASEWQLMEERRALSRQKFELAVEKEDLKKK